MIEKQFLAKTISFSSWRRINIESFLPEEFYYDMDCIWNLTGLYPEECSTMSDLSKTMRTIATLIRNCVPANRRCAEGMGNNFRKFRKGCAL